MVALCLVLKRSRRTYFMLQNAYTLCRRKMQKQDKMSISSLSSHVKVWCSLGEWHVPAWSVLLLTVSPLCRPLHALPTRIAVSLQFSFFRLCPTRRFQAFADIELHINEPTHNSKGGEEKREQLDIARRVDTDTADPLRIRYMSDVGCLGSEVGCRVSVCRTLERFPTNERMQRPQIETRRARNGQRLGAFTCLLVASETVG